MDAVSYPTGSIVEFINKNLIPIRMQSDQEPFATDFKIKWTPCLIILGADGKEHWRRVGYLPPEQFIPTILVGIARYYFDADKFPEATRHLDMVFKEYPTSDAIPEAIYLAGVIGYKETHNRASLKNAYEKLASRYPDSEWTKRALPYRLL
ncbi:MAG: hypothetical protein ABFD12_12225 [Syntrophorhabdus sp.]